MTNKAPRRSTGAGPFVFPTAVRGTGAAGYRLLKQVPAPLCAVRQDHKPQEPGQTMTANDVSSLIDQIFIRK